MTENKKVMEKWNGDFATLYRIDDILVFYPKKRDPDYLYEQEVSMDEVVKSYPYKAISFELDKVPEDVWMDLTFKWSGEDKANEVQTKGRQNCQNYG